LDWKNINLIQASSNN